MQKALADVVLYKIDAEKDENGPAYSEERGVKSYPTFIMLNGSGETVYRWLGYEKGFFLETMAATIADQTTIAQKETRFAAAPTEKDAALLARYQGSLGHPVESASLFRRAAELAGPSGPDYAMDIFNAVYRGTMAKEPVFKFDDARAAAEAALASRSAKPMDFIALAQRMSALADREKQPDLRIPYLRAAEERTRESTDEKVLAARGELMPDYALHVEKDKAKALEYKRRTLAEGWGEDPGELNNFAWWCFENQVNLAEARTLAEKAVELAEPGREKAMILDTLAELCSALGDCRESVALMRDAIKEDPENTYYQEQLARFEELLAKQS